MSRALLVAAAICLAIATLHATGTFTGTGGFDAWLAGGLFAWVLSALVP